jgi:hypothetical protein
MTHVPFEGSWITQKIIILLKFLFNFHALAPLS